MADQTLTDPATPLRVGSLFSGYGGLDLAVEEVFGARTIWFSEINKPVARVFSHHWPDAPNLGDITIIDWNTVPPVDILCGGFPCQDVSTVGKMAGLKPGTRSGLWAHMAAAIDALQPEWVVIENVRGLLSAPAIRANLEGDDDEQRNPGDAPPNGATARSVERDPWHLGETAARPLRAAGAVTRWEEVVGRPAPTPALLTNATDPRPAPAFVEWLMGLTPGWVTEPSRGLTTNQQLTALGNGVQPRQAAVAITSLLALALNRDE